MPNSKPNILIFTVIVNVVLLKAVEFILKDVSFFKES